MALETCKATSGITNTCDDLLRVGGADQTFWVGYLSELTTRLPISQTADISTLPLSVYKGLRRFDGQKFSHSFGSELVVASGGNKSYRHTLAARLLANSTADDVVLQDLALATDAFIIVQDNNENFFILGASKGMQAESDVQNTGTTGDADASDTITLVGSERTKPLRFRVSQGATAYQDTLNYIQAREI